MWSLRSRVNIVSMYWKLIERNGDWLEGLGTDRIIGDKGSWVCHKDLWSPNEMEKEGEDRFLQVSATGLGVRQGIGNKEQNAE